MNDSTDWWRGAVVYQVYPRSFQDSDGDGVGDLPGITRRLAHIASLGVDAVWIAPFFKSPMADMGYDVSDYRDVDPLFGTLADFDALLAEAHRLGLKIIIDQVLSHTSDRHAWFVESRTSRTNESIGRPPAMGAGCLLRSEISCRSSGFSAHQQSNGPAEAGPIFAL